MTPEQRRWLRASIDARVRELYSLRDDCPIQLGSSTGYRRGCRCPACTSAMSEAQRVRRQRQKFQVAA